MVNYELLILAAIGLAVLLFGYRIKKIAFFIVWFLIGYYLTTLLLPFIGANVPEIAENSLYQILLPLGGGAILALLGFSIEKFCISALCFALVMIITVQYFGTDWLTLAIGGVVAVISGGLAVRLMKPAIIIATAIAGAYAITMAIFSFIPEINQQLLYWPLIGGIAALGTLFQFKTTKKG